MRADVPRRLRILVLLVLCALTLPLAGAGAAAQTVGTSTINGGAEWQYSVEASSPNGGILIHQALGNTYFMYLQESLASLPAPDNLTLLDTVTLPRFRESFGVGEMPLLAQGSLPSSDWRLYELQTAEGNVLVLFIADVTAVPGVGSVEILLSPNATFATALASAKANITIDGTSALVADVPTTAILNAAGLPSDATAGQPTPPPVAAPPTLPTPTTAPAPPVAVSQQSQTVGQDTVAYGGGWQYSAEDSSESIGFFVQPGDDSIAYIYLSGPNAFGMDALAAAQQATDAFFSDFGAQNVAQVATELLPSGHAWGLTTFDLDATAGAFLIQVDVSTPGLVRAHILVGPRDQFPALVTSVQQAFQVNGAGAYSGLDPARITALLGAPVAQAPVGQPAQQTPAAPAGTTADSYRAQDAPTGCDRIGWVITDPAQLPASQAEIDQRGSCAGGATYVARCGTFSDGAGVQCTVDVAVQSAPMLVSYTQFTLVDAAGARYPVDFEGLMSMIMLFGVPELPEATVQPGATARGTVLFMVPAGAPTPWVIEVAPETIATTGEQPGVLVIEGPLSPFSVFGT